MGKAISYVLNGETVVLRELSSRYGIKVKTLKHRLDIKKWDLKKALEIPVASKLLNNTFSKKKIREGIEMYHFVLRRFYTKEHRLECYKTMLAELKQQRMKIAA